MRRSSATKLGAAMAPIRLRDMELGRAVDRAIPSRLAEDMLGVPRALHPTQVLTIAGAAVCDRISATSVRHENAKHMGTSGMAQASAALGRVRSLWADEAYRRSAIDAKARVRTRTSMGLPVDPDDRNIAKAAIPASGYRFH